MYQTKTLKVADELFIILALLHREHPERQSFEIGEVLVRAAKEKLGEGRSDQKSLKLHAYQHAAANLPPDPRGGKYRMIFRERDNRIRLLDPNDYVHPDRHQKFFPAYEEVPEEYHELLDWAKSRCETGTTQPSATWLEGLHNLRKMNKDIWKGVDPDDYVRSLREGWE